MGTIKDLEKANDEKVEKIERLNNIINEMEKMFDGDLDGFQTINEKGACNDIIEVIQNYKDKLKALKKGNNND
jgi:molecular chaperone GrpE (heat shock protein)